MAITKAERLRAVFEKSLKDFSNVQGAMRAERLQCLKDRRFYSIAGAQWEGPLAEQFANKPKFEMNKCHLAVIRIFNEYRNNRITVDFVSKDDTDQSKLAETCNGLYRNDEQDSVAEEAYDNAFEEGVGGGYGAWRLRTVYEDEGDPDNDEQRIRIEPIFDADTSVFFDLNAKRQDKADAKQCWVLTAMTHEAYKEEYGTDSMPASFPKEITEAQFDWFTPNVIFIAEYYVVENVGESVQIWKNKLTEEEEKYRDKDFTDDPELEATLSATGWALERTRRLKVNKVHKYLQDGACILKDMGYIAGRNIPIVPYYGKRWFVDNIERCMGHVRLATDAQRLANMQRSKLGELAAGSSNEKPIFTPEQIAGHQIMWSNDNVKDYPYLLINPMTDANGQMVAAGPIAYTHPPAIPPAMAALLAITEQDMQDLLGNQQAAEEMKSNISGKVVELVQAKLDMQTFIYMSNMKKSVRRSGEIWLSMAKDILVEKGRKMKTVGEQGEAGYATLNIPKVDANGGSIVENNLEDADFDVAVDVGPSSASKRAATVRALTGMMQVSTDPETMSVLSAMAMMNMEGEGVNDVRDYFRNKLLKMGALKPTEDESKQLEEELANTPPDPNAEYLKAAATAEEAKAVKARADTILTLAKADESQANTTLIASQIDSAEQTNALAVIDRFGQHLMPQPAETAAPVTN